MIKYEGAVVKAKTKEKAGLYGKPTAKAHSNAPVYNASGAIKFAIDAQKRERANHSHWRLIAAKSAFLGSRSLPALENLHIDLYSRDNHDLIIYEMKSVESTNLLGQVRRAIAQLYEYRYIFSAPAARLCIVTNSGIQKADQWLLNYLANDRLIAYEWTENFKDFQCNDASKSLLEQFAP